MQNLRLGLAAILCFPLISSLPVSADDEAKQIAVQPGVHVVTLGVTDLKKSFEFYRDGLGFPTKMTPDGGIVLFTTSGARMFIYPFDKLAADVGMKVADGEGPGSRFTGITFGHAVDSPEGVDQMLRLAKKAGGLIVKPARLGSWGGYTGYFSDPDGYVWEVAYFDSWRFSDEGTLIFAD